MMSKSHILENTGTDPHAVPESPAVSRMAPSAAPDGNSAATNGAEFGVEPSVGRSIAGRIRPIADLDLASFQQPAISGNWRFVVRVAWYLTSALLFQHALALLPSRVKSAILRAFGAKVGRGLVLKPKVQIKSPWFLELGDHVWIGEGVWIDNHTHVSIGANSCLSQGVVVFTGNHDWSDPAFAFFCKPVTIGEGVWVTAFQRLGPGTIVPPHVAVTDRPPA